MKDGGPAFPGHETEKRQSKGGMPYDFTAYRPGMSLLDYFAGQALAGLMTESGDWEGGIIGDDLHDEATGITIGDFCYNIARNMLAAKEQQP